jgi:hypothetical protein
MWGDRGKARIGTEVASKVTLASLYNSGRSFLPPVFQNVVAPIKSRKQGLKIEPIRPSDMLVTAYKFTRRHNPEDHNHLHHREYLKFQIVRPNL